LPFQIKSFGGGQNILLWTNTSPQAFLGFPFNCSL